MAKLTEAQRRQLDEKQLTYVVWAGTPKGLRHPDTEEELCTVIGVGRTTLWRWKQDPRVLDAVRYVTLQHAGDPDKVGKILDMVFNKAVLENDLKAADLWLKAVGVNSMAARENTILDALEEDDFANYSDEELARLRDEALAGAQEDERIASAKQALKDRGIEPTVVE